MYLINFFLRQIKHIIFNTSSYRAWSDAIKMWREVPRYWFHLRHIKCIWRHAENDFEYLLKILNDIIVGLFKTKMEGY